MRLSTPLPLSLGLCLAAAPLLAQEPEPIYEPEERGSISWTDMLRFLPVPTGIPRGAFAPEGQFAAQVRASQTTWDGMRDGRDDVSGAAQFANYGYTTAGDELVENRVELDLAYGLAEGWRLFATIPYIERELDWTTQSVGTGTSESSGLGDVIVGAALTPVFEGDRLWDLALGVSLPTGEFDARDDYAGVSDTVLPFPMQLGTGTIDLHPSATFMRREEAFVWGARLAARFHTAKNSDDWAKSDEARVDVWLARPIADRLLGTLRLQGEWWGYYHGSSADMDRTRSALEEPKRQGGSLVQAVLGLGYDLTDPAVTRNRLELEVAFPIDEWLDGPAMSRELSVLVGWRALL